MKKIIVSSALSMCLVLMLATTIMLFAPIHALAYEGSCTASCPGGKSVTCQTDSNGFCAAEDNVGCSGATIKSCGGDEVE